MSWTFVVRHRELSDFRRCRRAWDFSARIHQNRVPRLPPRMVDIDRVLHEALAVYYYPAMDDWDRAIVRPLAVQGFRRAMQEERQRYERFAPLTAEQAEAWAEQAEFRLRTGAELEEERLRWSSVRRGTRAAHGGAASRSMVRREF